MAKKFTWNKKAVSQAVGKVNAEFLFSAGAKIRREAMKALNKPGKIDGKGHRTHAPEGVSPYRWGNQLRDFMRFSFDPSSNTMVIGPTLLPGAKSSASSVPHVLEAGGSASVKYKRSRQSGKAKKRKHIGSYPRGQNGEEYRYFHSCEARLKAVQSSAFQRWSRMKQKDADIIQQTITIKQHPYMQKALRITLSEGVMKYLYKKACERAYK